MSRSSSTRDFRYEQLWDKQAGPDLLAGGTTSSDRDLRRRRADRGGGSASSPGFTSSQPQVIRDQGIATTIGLLTSAYRH